MKSLIMLLVKAVIELFRRFKTGEPANPYEGLAFGALRSALAIAFFPPGLSGVADAR